LSDFEINRHVKSIVNPRDVYCISAHSFKCVGKVVDIHKNEVDTNNIMYDYTLREPLHDKIRINHYFSKSYEEFLQKRNKGIVSNFDFRTEEDFHRHDKNDIKNDTIMDKYAEEIKKRLNG
jgi:hypothetical protein